MPPGSGIARRCNAILRVPALLIANTRLRPCSSSSSRRRSPPHVARTTVRRSPPSHRTRSRATQRSAAGSSRRCAAIRFLPPRCACGWTPPLSIIGSGDRADASSWRRLRIARCIGGYRSRIGVRSPGVLPPSISFGVMASAGSRWRARYAGTPWSGAGASSLTSRHRSGAGASWRCACRALPASLPAPVRSDRSGLRHNSR